MRISTLLLAMTVGVAPFACGTPRPAPDDPSVKPQPEPAVATTEAPTPASAPVPTPSIAASDVIGSWKTVGTDFEELSIEDGGTWSSFLHARPMYSGTWSLEGDALTLASDAAGEPMVLSKITRDGDKLSGSLDGKPVAWQRIAAD